MTLVVEDAREAAPVRAGEDAPGPRGPGLAHGGALALAWAGAAASAFLVHRHANPVVEGVCGEGSGCEQVLASRWSALGGVPLAWLGVALHLTIAALLVAAAGAGERGRARGLRAAGLLALAGTLVSGALLFVQVGVVRAFCAFCTVSAVAVAVTYVLVGRAAKARGAGRSPARAARWGLSFTLASVALATAFVLAQRGEVVARFDGEAWTTADLERGMRLTLDDVRRQTFHAKRAWIERAAEDRAVAAEAARRGTSPEALLESEVAGPVEVTDAEVDGWLARRAPVLSEAERRRRARDAIVTERHQERRRAFLDGLLRSHRLEVLIEPPPSPRVAIDESLGHSAGPASAAVRLVVFSDFECPYCAALSTTLRRLRDSRPDVAVTFLHFPLDTHAHAEAAAVAAEAAAADGRFEAVHDLLFRRPRDLDDAAIAAALSEAGVDEAKVAAARPAAALSVARQREEGRRLGLASVPSLFLNGRRIGGAVDYAELVRLVEDETRLLPRGPR